MGKAQDPGGEIATHGQRQRDAEESIAPGRAERPGGLEIPPVDTLEGRDQRLHRERQAVHQ